MRFEKNEQKNVSTSSTHKPNPDILYLTNENGEARIMEDRGLSGSLVTEKGPVSAPVQSNDSTRIRPREFRIVNNVEFSQDERFEIQKRYYDAMITLLVTKKVILPEQGQECVDRMQRRFRKRN